MKLKTKILTFSLASILGMMGMSATGLTNKSLITPVYAATQGQTYINSLYGYTTTKNTLYMTLNPNAYTDYTSSRYYDTGIQIYGTSNNGVISTTSSMKSSSNTVYFDFTTSNNLYVPSGVYQDVCVPMEYTFEVLSSSGSTYWKARYYNDLDIANDKQKTIKESIYIYGSGTTTTSISTEDYLSRGSSWKPNVFGKRSTYLPNGNYTIKVTRRYYVYFMDGDNTWTMRIYDSTETMSSSLLVDSTTPSLSMKDSNNTALASGAYTNKKVTFTASDTNYYGMYYRKPNSTSTYYTSSTSLTLGDTTGWYYVYSQDSLNNKSTEMSFYYDPTIPTGYISSNGTTIPSGGYISKPFAYNASDSQSGIDKIYYKAPFMSNYQIYTSGTIIPSNAGDGWYYFYSVDKAGNTSSTYQVFLETANPSFTLYKNNSSVYTHSISKNETIDTGLYYKRSDLVKIAYSSMSNVSTTNLTKNTNYVASNLTSDSYTISVTTATGLVTKYIIHIVDEEPYLTLNNNKLNDGSITYVNADTRVFATIDSVILNSGSTGMAITSTGENQVNEFVNYSTAKNYLLTTPEGTETTYHITLNDVAGYTASYTIIVDKKNPEGSWMQGNKQIVNGSFVNTPFHFEFDESLYTAMISINGGEYVSYHQGMYDVDGVYTIILTDKAGNKTTYILTHDSINPEGNLYADYKEVPNNTITNGKVYFSWDEDATCTVNGNLYQKNSVITEDGIYTFVLTDKAGNYSTYKIEIDTVAPSNNQTVLNDRKTQTISKWYTVEFDGHKTSFKDYEEALVFAKKLEFERSVSTLYLDDVSAFTQTHLIASGDKAKVGYYYRYKSAQNPNTELYYFDYDNLDEVISNYAKNYISTVNYLDYDKTHDYGDLSESMYENTWNNFDGIKAPIVNNYTFTNVDSNYIYARLSGTQDAYTLVDVTKTFKEQFSITGLYEIKEVDKAGNVSIYYVFLDNTAPTIKVKAEVFGEGESKEILITKDSLEVTNSYYYKLFSIKEIIDNDMWSNIKITNNGKATYYTYGDELPTLSDGGKYEISIYDRLNNSYSFNVYIVGKEANINFNVNEDSTSFNLGITLDQDFDTVISLEVYHNGTKLEGITPDNLAYCFDKDGTYTIILKDNFGRIIEKTFVFDKSLPNGNLSIDNQTKTKEEVSFTFDSSKYYAEIYVDGNLVATNNNGDVKLMADGKYRIKLINLSDLDNVNTYSFEIDNTAPVINLDGVDSGSTTNNNVTITWDDVNSTALIKNADGTLTALENGSVISKEGTYEVVVSDELGNSSTVSFTIDKSLSYKVNIGSESTYDIDTPTNQNVTINALENLNATVTKDGVAYDYQFGDVLSEEGTYKFFIMDDYGNNTTFTIVIDKSVNASINVGNGSITNDEVTISMGEAGTIVVTKDGIPMNYNAGGKLTEEGKYEVTIYDAYGNELHTSFEIVNGTKTSLDYHLGDDVKIIKVIHDGEEIEWNSNSLNFNLDGTYVVTVNVDGIEYSFTLSLDTTAPEITLNGIENGDTKDTTVTISDLTEEGMVEVYKDGVLIDYELGKEISDYGKYEIHVTDNLGNTRTYSFTLEYQMNGGAIALIIIGALALGVGVFLVTKNRKKIFKTKK